jgi:orotate phosphoribosyltransferase-like protein
MNVKQDPNFIEKVRHLSQDEGLTDKEIAAQLGYSRKTIVWVRVENNIPKCNLENKRDKPMLCYECKKVYLVKRSSKIGEDLCPICNPLNAKDDAKACI